MDFVKKSGGSWHRDASTLHIPFPTITSPHFNRGSWHWVASALCCLYPATIAARFNWGSWHQDASALCRLFPATTAICCSRGTWHQVAIALRHCPTSSSQLGSSVLGCQHLFFPLSRQPLISLYPQLPKLSRTKTKRGLQLSLACRRQLHQHPYLKNKCHPPRLPSFL